jgi:hypothetical protein
MFDSAPNHTALATETIPIGDVVIDVYPRLALNQERVDFFVELMTDGEIIFPPIVVVPYKNRYSCLDGAHRLKAYEKLNHKAVVCYVEVIDSNDMDLHHFLLRGVNLNSQSSLPLSKTEVKDAIIKSFKLGKLSANEIIRCSGFSPTYIYKILNPYINPAKKEVISSVVALHRAGKTIEEIKELIPGRHEKTIGRYIVAAEKPQSLDEETLNELELYSSTPFSEITKNTYRGLQRIKRNEEIAFIAESLNVSVSWVRYIGIILLYMYQNPQMNLDSKTDLGLIRDFFNDTQDRIIFLGILFEMNKNLLVERRDLLIWLEKNPAPYSDEKDVQIVRKEMCYWAELDRKDSENKKIIEDFNIIDADALDSMIGSFTAFQHNIKIQKKNISEKQRISYIEQLNRLQVVMNDIRSELQGISHSY